VFKPATKKQQGFYKSLTGEWLPRGTSSSRASQLIDKAKRGEITKKVPVLRVKGQSIWSPGWVDHNVVKYVVDRDYAPLLGPFATFAEAQAEAEAYVARSGEQLEIVLEPHTVRQVCVD
jgi:hypothetical protein